MGRSKNNDYFRLRDKKKVEEEYDNLFAEVHAERERQKWDRNVPLKPKNRKYMPIR